MYKYLLAFLLFVNFLSAQIPDGYYDGTEGLIGEDLKATLHEIIDDHIEFPYTSGGTDTWDILKETDRDPDNPDNVILFYTGWSVDGEQEYNSGNGWSREHVWAKSHGDFGTAIGPGTDVHHLRPCDISVNSARGNKDFDNGGSEYIDGDGPTGCFSDADSWEARDEVKGDVARMIFYMAVRYEGDNGEIDLEMVDYVNSAPDPYHGKFSTLMEWNLFDPVDEFEQNRNDIIYEDYQGNRNPFIDHPEFASNIWGETNADDPPELPVLFQLNQNYPNPFNPSTMISFQVSGDREHNTANLTIYNMKGQIVKNFPISFDTAQESNGIVHSLIWDGFDDSNRPVTSGIYFYKLKIGTSEQTRKMILLK
jgi:endonuclease I